MQLRLVGRVIAVAIVASLTPGLAPVTATAAAPIKPTVGPPSAFDAPIGKPGGAMNPNASCGEDYTVTPRMRWTVTNLETSEVTSFDWFDAYPGMQFPRLEVGTYRSEAIVRCRGERVSRTDQFRIGQKTQKSTISVSEYRRVQVGMTRARVRQIVGNGGVDPSKYDGTTTRTFHQMKFWAWSIIEFRHGRVHRKFWNVGHD